MNWLRDIYHWKETLLRVARTLPRPQANGVKMYQTTGENTIETDSLSGSDRQARYNGLGRRTLRHQIEYNSSFPRAVLDARRCSARPARLCLCRPSLVGFRLTFGAKESM